MSDDKISESRETYRGETHAALPTIYATAEEILQALNQTAKAAESVFPPEEQAGYTQND